MPSTVFNTMSNTGMPILIGTLFVSSVVGFYFFANRMVRFPLGLVFGSFSQVYHQKAVELFYKDKKELYDFTKRTQYKIGLLLMPVLIIISFVAPYVFSFIFGEKWIVAGEYIKYFAIFIYFNSLYSPISTLGDILEKQKLLMFFNFSLVVSQIIIMYFCSVEFELDFKYTILYVSIIGSLHFIILNLYMINQLKRKIKND
jgi:O-antigen/teichoic acid export membrane protein